MLTKHHLPKAEDLPKEVYDLGGIKVNTYLEGTSKSRKSSQEILNILIKAIKDGVFSDVNTNAPETPTKIRHN